jgi:hypothetical protein
MAFNIQLSSIKEYELRDIIKQNPFLLEHIIDQTYELCEIAVTTRGMSLQFVKKQNNYLCELAVDQDPWSLQYVKNQTEHICKIAVKRDGRVLQFVKNKKYYLCKLAVIQNGYAIQYINEQEQTDELCTIAIEQDSSSIRYIKNQNDELCLLALSKNPLVLKYIKKNKNDILNFIIDKYTKEYNNINKDDHDDCMICLENNPDNMRVFKCNHIIHKECLFSLIINASHNLQLSCPYCRSDVF